MTETIEMGRLDDILAKVKGEYIRAFEKHGGILSTHEGYAVLQEEVDELWEDIKANKTDSSLEEAIQVAAMAVKYAYYIGKKQEEKAKAESEKVKPNWMDENFSSVVKGIQNNLKIINVVGYRRMGKTTLAAKLFRNFPNSFLLVQSASQAEYVCKEHFSRRTVNNIGYKFMDGNHYKLLIIDDVRSDEAFRAVLRHEDYDHVIVINGPDTV